MTDQEKQIISGDEIKKEFQVERMILFSDAVFAIVITLMAIDIKLPEGTEGLQWSTDLLSQLAPTFFAYCISFLFIGAIWYQHLTMFSVVKDYDRGLVIRNLLLLFFITLFPFSATAMTMADGAMIPFFMYMGIILLSMTAQYFLYHYIVIERPALRVNAHLEEKRTDLQKRKFSLIVLTIFFILITITYFIITDPEKKSLSILWMVLFPVVYRLIRKKNVPISK